jgi:hypothetical protein
VSQPAHNKLRHTCVLLALLLGSARGASGVCSPGQSTAQQQASRSQGWPSTLWGTWGRLLRISARPRVCAVRRHQTHYNKRFLTTKQQISFWRQPTSPSFTSVHTPLGRPFLRVAASRALKIVTIPLRARQTALRAIPWPTGAVRWPARTICSHAARNHQLASGAMREPSRQRVLEEGEAAGAAGAAACAAKRGALRVGAFESAVLTLPLLCATQLCSEHGISKDGMLEDYATQVRRTGGGADAPLSCSSGCSRADGGGGGTGCAGTHRHTSFVFSPHKSLRINTTLAPRVMRACLQTTQRYRVGTERTCFSTRQMMSTTSRARCSWTWSLGQHPS